MKRILARLLVVTMLLGTVGLFGCADDGSNGASAYDIAVSSGVFTPDPSLTPAENQAAWLASLDPSNPITAAANVEPEACSTCHTGDIVRSGQSHQDAYDELFQQGVIAVSNVQYSNNGTNDTVTFEMTKNALDFDCTMADSLNVRYAQYTGVDNAEFISIAGTNDLLSLKGTVTYDAGTNTCTSVNPQTALGDLSALNGIIAVYGQDELVDTIGHISLAKYPYAAILTIGTVGYSSAANTAGCEKCHTVPYYKHGYIRGDVSGTGAQDFWTCKVCHVDNRDGGHTDWQYSVDDPTGWATGATTTADYSYKTRLMNDVHMSHAMEFPYPQSMANCNTCHEGKLTQTLAPSNFTIETCKSCHPITGGTDAADANGDFAIDTRDMALETIWTNLGVLASHETGGVITSLACTVCHTGTGAGGAKAFNEIHTGYNPLIYDAATATKYADAITVSIDSVTVTGSNIDIAFSATGSAGAYDFADIVPTVQIALYGYGTKDFIASNHDRIGSDRAGEFTLDGTGTSPYFSNEVDDPTNGSWSVTYTLPTEWAAMVAAGTVSQAEVAVLPGLDHASITTVDHSGNPVPAQLGLNAVSETIDLTADSATPEIADYFSGANALVSVDGSGTSTKGCNSCHDQLATTFHSGDRGGNITVCRMCHVVMSGGSHLAGQSRSIDSYVHAIHRFQAFDVDEVDFTDPVEVAHYEEHINFLFPDFATINCLACHNQSRTVDSGNRAAFDIPSQDKSMPGLLSKVDEVPGGPSITAPEVVTGPAARACGGCHRAEFINADDASGFAAFNQHTKSFGYRIENDSNDVVRDTVIDKIMSMFK